MKKIITLSMLIVACIYLQSCKKKSPEGTTYLLSKSTKYSSSGEFVSTFEYDSRDRLISVTHNSSWSGKYGSTFSYDDSDRVIGEVKYELPNYTKGRVAVFEYFSDKVVATYPGTDGQLLNSPYTYFLSNGRVVKMGYEASPAWGVFTYDSRGNITSDASMNKASGVLSEKTIFNYDDQKSPFSMIKGSNVSFFGNPSEQNATQNSRVNNIIGSIGAYEFNSAGFPTSYHYTGSDGKDVTTVRYEYLVR